MPRSTTPRLARVRGCEEGDDTQHGHSLHLLNAQITFMTGDSTVSRALPAWPSVTWTVPRLMTNARQCSPSPLAGERLWRGRTPKRRFVQQQQSRQRLMQRAGHHLIPRRQQGQEAPHRHHIKFAGMAPPIGMDIPANPVHIGPLGLEAVVLQPQTAANFVQQVRSRRTMRRPAIGLFRIGYQGVVAVICHIEVSMPSISTDWRSEKAHAIGITRCLL